MPANRLIGIPALLLTLLPALVPAQPAASGDAPGHERELVELPPPVREEILTNMRDHLATIEKVSRKLAAGDYGSAADTAEAGLGMSAIMAHGGPQRAQYLPADWRKIGMAMHQAASRFAIAARDAETDADLRAAFTSLADVMAQCVACHAAFRLH